MKADHVYIRCAELSNDSEDNQANPLAFEYYGADGSLPKEFYPYQGKKLQPDYDAPYMAVKVKNAQVRY